MPVTIPEPRASIWRRLGWFAALYVGGIVAVAAVAFLLRVWIKAG